MVEKLGVSGMLFGRYLMDVPHSDAILIFDGSLPISELRRRKLPPEFVL